MSLASAELRSMYRRFLRELPARSPSILANPSSVQKHIRHDLKASSSQANPAQSQEDGIAKAEQFLQYIKSQRIYATLIERYNPGMNMEEEERLRLTARRVGMNLPIEASKGPQHE